MELKDLVGEVSDFDAASPGEKIRLFAWWLHTHCSLVTFTTGDIKGCYEQLHLPVPNIAMYLTRMRESKPPKAMRKGDSYHLARDARTDLDAKYGTHHSVVAVSKILSDLPAQVPNINERVFLQEALKCYRHEAYSLLFNQIIQHGEKYFVIRPTAFKEVMGGKTKHFLHHHDDSIRVASTKDYLTLHADQYGLAFKLHLPPTMLGMKTRNLVRDNVKQAMSANFTTTKIEKHVVDGVEITLVLEAELHEISLCEFGANSDAFAVLVDDTAEWVTDMCKSLRMTDEMHRAHIGRAIRRLEELSKSSSAPG
jgi:HK97 family phage prohead protease